MIDLHHSALLADLAVSAEARTHLNSYCSLFNALGSLSVFLSYITWNKDDSFTFQYFCLILALISIVGFVVSTSALKKAHASTGKYQELENVRSEKVTEKILGMKDEKRALKNFLRQLASHHNFMWFAAMNLVQVFHCHFNSNFFPLFLENLLGDRISPGMGSILLGISFVAPHINNLYFLTLCRRHGTYRVIQGLFYVKLALSFLMLILGPNHVLLMCLFIASNRVFTEGTCKLLSLVISDLVDEDYVVHNRKEAVSALLFGTAAFVSKPGQTLAPLLGTWLLSIQTGHDVFSSGNEMGSIKLDSGSLDNEASTLYRTGVFHLLVYVPIVCAILQLILWSQFTLHGKRLGIIKSVRAGAKYVNV